MPTQTSPKFATAVGCGKSGRWPLPNGVVCGAFKNECRAMCTSSGWFKRIKPPRTFSNHIIGELVECVEFTLHDFGVVRLYRTLSN